MVLMKFARDMVFPAVAARSTRYLAVQFPVSRGLGIQMVTPRKVTGMSKSQSPITKNKYNEVFWDSRKDDEYVVTGVLVNGKRFKPIRTHSWAYANGINLYRGTKWLVRDGKRYIIQRVYN